MPIPFLKFGKTKKKHNIDQSPYSIILPRKKVNGHLEKNLIYWPNIEQIMMQNVPVDQTMFSCINDFGHS